MYYIQYLSQFLYTTVPAPTSVSVNSDPFSPIIAESNVTLTCSVELSPAVDVPVTVNVQLSDPAGSPLTTTIPSISGFTYTSTAMVSAFGRDQSGVYTCTATVSSTSSFLTDSGSTSGTARVTVGKPLVLLLHITSALSEV